MSTNYKGVGEDAYTTGKVKDGHFNLSSLCKETFTGTTEIHGRYRKESER
jgi:hypothetical protein